MDLETGFVSDVSMIAFICSIHMFWIGGAEIVRLFFLSFSFIIVFSAYFLFVVFLLSCWRVLFSFIFSLLLYSNFFVWVHFVSDIHCMRRDIHFRIFDGVKLRVRLEFPLAKTFSWIVRSITIDKTTFQLVVWSQCVTNSLASYALDTVLVEYSGIRFICLGQRPKPMGTSVSLTYTWETHLC